MQTSATEHQKKYNNVKAVLFKLRDDKKVDDQNTQTLQKEFDQIEQAYTKLQETHKAQINEKENRSKLMSKRYEKTKQVLQKKEKDLTERNEKIKELEKQVAGFSAAQEAFDV